MINQGHDCKQAHLGCEHSSTTVVKVHLWPISDRDINNCNISRSFHTHIDYHNRAWDQSCRTMCWCFLVHFCFEWSNALDYRLWPCIWVGSLMRSSSLIFSLTKISVTIPYIQNYSTLSKLGACCKDKSFENSPTPIAHNENHSLHVFECRLSP